MSPKRKWLIRWMPVRPRISIAEGVKLRWAYLTAEEVTEFRRWCRVRSLNEDEGLLLMVRVVLRRSRRKTK